MALLGWKTALYRDGRGEDDSFAADGPPIIAYARSVDDAELMAFVRFLLGGGTGSVGDARSARAVLSHVLMQDT